MKTISQVSALAVAVVAIAACAHAPDRSPAPAAGVADLDLAHPYGIPRSGLRDWGDDLAPAKVDEIVAYRVEGLRKGYADAIDAGDPIRLDFLALSGGGPDGAYGAGLLAGWTARGDRPVFNVVTGVSTGAAIALFAFLGSDYDDALREIYTTFETDDLVSERFVSGLLGGPSLFDVSGYRALIERYVDDVVVSRIADEHAKGRLLLIGTTNLDAARPVVWNIGEIAASGHRDARRLIIDVVQASFAIPVAFPAVAVPVTIDGAAFDELHVDGGATEQVLLFNPAFSFAEIDAALGVKVERRIHVVVNNALRKPYRPIERAALDVGAAAVGSLIGGCGSGDVYKIYAVAQRDGAAFALSSIPREFTLESEELFDPKYMRALYELGEERGSDRDHWSPRPTGLAAGG